MNKEGNIWHGREELAEFLFDGNKEKAEKLLVLIESFTNPIIPPEFKNLTMNIPEETCKWCSSSSDCLFYMPDSVFHCKGKCKEYEEKKN
jgi:hypothetical protein